MTIDASNSDLRMIICIIRKTFGFNKIEDWIALSQFEKYTGKHRVEVCRSLKNLLKRKIIIKDDNFRYRLNYDNMDQWVVTKQLPVTKQLLVTKLLIPSNNSVNQLVTKQLPTKDILQNTYIQNTYSANFLKDKYSNLVQIWNCQNIIQHDINKLDYRKIDQFVNKLKPYTLEDVIIAINNYGKVINNDCWFTYKWTLLDFLKRKSAEKFYKDNFVFENFTNKSKTDKRSRTKEDIYRDKILKERGVI